MLFSEGQVVVGMKVMRVRDPTHDTKPSTAGESDDAASTDAGFIGWLKTTTSGSVPEARFPPIATLQDVTSGSTWETTPCGT